MARTSLRLRDELLERAKRQAAADGRTLTSLVEEGLTLVLAESARVARTPVRLPISKATGGTVPGVDLNDSRSLEERMDES